jgi:hypothetical protein
MLPWHPAYEVVGPLPALPGTNYAVNQQLPVCLSWSPSRFAGWYQLQIATSNDFATPIVDVPHQTNAGYVWSNAAPGSTYYYRINTSNDGGTSAWSIGSFQTVPPSILGPLDSPVAQSPLIHSAMSLTTGSATGPGV